MTDVENIDNISDNEEIQIRTIRSVYDISIPHKLITNSKVDLHALGLFCLLSIFQTSSIDAIVKIFEDRETKENVTKSVNKLIEMGYLTKEV